MATIPITSATLPRKCPERGHNDAQRGLSDPICPGGVAAHPETLEFVGRSGRIRTCDPCVPNAVNIF